MTSRLNQSTENDFHPLISSAEWGSTERYNTKPEDRSKPPEFILPPVLSRQINVSSPTDFTFQTAAENLVATSFFG